jgi:FkbM family methyltransferase
VALADIYLDAFPFSGACSLYDPLLVGIPVVTRAGNVCRSRHSKAILEELGLTDWVMGDGASYVRAAVKLAHDPSKRDAERKRLAMARATSWRLDDTASYAAKLMPTFDRLFNEWNGRAQECAALEVAEVNRRLASLADEAAKHLYSFTDRDLVISLVLPYLRWSDSKRLIDVGACVGALTSPFLDEGWQAVMFEPDSRCHAQLTALVGAHVGRAQLEKSVVTAGPKVSVAFHMAGLPGLSGLSSSPYAPDISTVEMPAIALTPYIDGKGWHDVDFIKIDAEGHDIEILRSIDFKVVSPRLVMVEFGDHFAGQDRDSISAALQEMRRRGYRACVFCFHALGKFERHEWGTRLLTIAADEVPALPSNERLFGNILFFRNDDRDFVPSVLDFLGCLCRRPQPGMAA